MGSVALANGGIYIQPRSLADFLFKRRPKSDQKAIKVNRPWSYKEDRVGDTVKGHQGLSVHRHFLSVCPFVLWSFGPFFGTLIGLFSGLKK